MGLLLASCFTRAIVLLLIAVKTAKSAKDKQTPYAPKAYDKMMVCNLVQNSGLNEAVTKLEAKLDSPIALVNNAYTLEPKSTGKLVQYFLDMFQRIVINVHLKIVTNWSFSSLLIQPFS